MVVKVRFAPSPTGKLHVGNMRIAMINYLFMRKHSGTFVLRIDDTDKERSTKESEIQILEDLQWCGIHWDEFYRQSERLHKYDTALANLRSKGLIYPCFETKEELSLKRKVQTSQGIPPIYDRSALQLSNEEIEKYQQDGRPMYWRFKLDQSETVHWKDLVHGDISIPLGSVSDPILVKPDGGYMYTFASVVDDSDMGITHIIRGDDHITNTAVQISIFKALAGHVPEFGHIPLMVSADGSDVSKRTDSPLSIINMHKEGIEPLALWDILSTLGTPYNPNPNDNLDDIVNKFDIGNRSLATVKFNINDVRLLTKKIIAEMSYEDVRDFLKDLPYANKVFWDTIKNNIDTMQEAKTWHYILFENMQIGIDDHNFIQVMFDTLNDNFDQWIANLKEKTGRKGFNLFHPLRMALTSRESGPELKKIFELMGVNRVTKLLQEGLKV